jgi:hypothetical protein
VLMENFRTWVGKDHRFGRAAWSKLWMFGDPGFHLRPRSLSLLPPMSSSRSWRTSTTICDFPVSPLSNQMHPWQSSMYETLVKRRTSPRSKKKKKYRGSTHERGDVSETKSTFLLSLLHLFVCLHAYTCRASPLLPESMHTHVAGSCEEMSNGVAV